MNEDRRVEEKFDFLIVDDHKEMLYAIRDILKQVDPGNRILMSQSGAQALSILRENKVAFVISDWNMPNMTGVELLSLIRKNPEHYDTPVMIISDEVEREQFIYAMEQGADAYQLKPFTADRLTEAIASVLRARAHQTPFQQKTRDLRLLLLLEKYDSVIRWAKEMMQEEASIDTALLLCIAYLQKFEYAKAREALRFIPKYRENSKACHLMGLAYMGEKKYKKALVSLENAIELNPLDQDRKIDAGKVYLEVGMDAEAYEIFESILLSGSTDLSLVGISSALLKKNQLDKASKYLDGISEFLPETVGVCNEYAIEIRKTGDYKKSIQYYKKCLKIHPKNEIYLFNLARVYYEAGKMRDAKTFLKRVLMVNSGHKYAVKLLKHIKHQ
ncbi:MAG: response regulator [Desulfobulbaceae bacterium]|nr:response regulator [Desulfobulbaceae bacterium]